MGLLGNNPGTYFAFSMIVTLSFVGNWLVLGVMITKRGALQKPYNIFICSLACTDIITSIFLIFSRYLYLPAMPENEFAATLFCSTIWNACILFGLGYVSIYTCLVLTIERWLAIVKPNTYRKTKPRHAVIVVGCVWFWGLLIQATTLFRGKADFEKGLNNKLVYEYTNIKWVVVIILILIIIIIIIIISEALCYTSVTYKVSTVKYDPKVALIAAAAVYKIRTGKIYGQFPRAVSPITISYSIITFGSCRYF